jgi:alginate O-acetyltransferase complex protein AlgI
MAFTSHIFLFYFLPAVLLLYSVIPQRRPVVRNVLLLAAGYVFYAWLSPWFAALLFGLTVVNYALSRGIAASGGQRTRFLLAGLAVGIDLAVLGFFKYIVFVEENLNSLLLLVGRDTLPLLRVILPVGISFYTFKLISSIVDVYRGQALPGGTLKRSLGVDSGVEEGPSPRPSALIRRGGPPGPVRPLLDFACYVSFFPQLLSGPIQRFGTIDRKSEPMPTFAEQLAAREHTLDKFARGAALFMLGFAKKILLANAVALVADAVFAAAAPGTLDAWFGALAYSFQLYFDFSAYSEMAIGIGLMLGFECPRNFDAPYRAGSFGDFWRRWHISLSSWLRDYLYIPLGGSRAGAGRTYANLLIVFLLCGLWHGAGWTFLVWGAWHGFWLIVERVREGMGPIGRMGPVGRFTLHASRFTTFLLVTLGWVVFRATDLAEAGRMLAIMLWPRAAQDGSTLLSAVIYTRGHLILMALCAVLVFQPVQGFDWTHRLSGPKVFVLAILFVMAMMTMFAQSFRSFLYFQF